MARRKKMVKWGTGQVTCGPGSTGAAQEEKAVCITNLHHMQTSIPEGSGLKRNTAEYLQSPKEGLQFNYSSPKYTTKSEKIDHKLEDILTYQHRISVTSLSALKDSSIKKKNE